MAKETGNLAVIDWFERLCAPLGGDEFRQWVYEKEPHVVREAFDPGYFSFRKFEALLRFTSEPYPKLYTLSAGRRANPLARQQLVGHLREGRTLIVQDADEVAPELREITESVEEALGANVGGNLYFSSRSIQGFDRHYDTHDVFVLQLDGAKRWGIYTRAVEAPLWESSSHDRAMPSEKLLEVVLEPGDALYLPRGYWHEALAHERDSLHLTIGVHVRTGVDFAKWIADEMRSRVLFRVSDPFRLSSLEAITGLGVSEHEYVTRLAEEMTDLLADPDLADRYRIHVAASSGRTPINLQTSRTPKVVRRPPGALPALRRVASQQICEVFGAGRVVTIPEEWEAVALTLLHSPSDLSVADVQTDIGGDQLQLLVALLCRNGLLEARDQ